MRPQLELSLLAILAVFAVAVELAVRLDYVPRHARFEFSGSEARVEVRFDRFRHEYRISPHELWVRGGRVRVPLMIHGPWRRLRIEGEASAVTTLADQFRPGSPTESTDRTTWAVDLSGDAADQSHIECDERALTGLRQLEIRSYLFGVDRLSLWLVPSSDIVTVDLPSTPRRLVRWIAVTLVALHVFQTLLQRRWLWLPTLVVPAIVMGLPLMTAFTFTGPWRVFAVTQLALIGVAWSVERWRLFTPTPPGPTKSAPRPPS